MYGELSVHRCLHLQAHPWNLIVSVGSDTANWQFAVHL